MPKKIEVVPGERFERLVYIEERPRKSNRRRALFQCDCGQIVEASVHDVRTGHTSSCGCLHTEAIRSARSHGATIGRKLKPEYSAWKAMKERCLYPKSISYYNYGGRGIQIHPSWINDYEAFLNHVGRKPSPKHSLDRIDVNGNYEPGNVRWATRTEQRRNSRNVHPVTLDGETRLIVDWAALSGVPEQSIAARLRDGWDVRQAIYQPVGERRL